MKGFARNQWERAQRTIKTAVALLESDHESAASRAYWPVELGRDYDFLMDLREISDYSGVGRVSEENARRAVEAAQRIIAACQEELSSLD